MDLALMVVGALTIIIAIVGFTLYLAAFGAIAFVNWLTRG